MLAIADTHTYMGCLIQKMGTSIIVSRMVPPPIAVMIPKTIAPNKSTFGVYMANTPVIAKAAAAIMFEIVFIMASWDFVASWDFDCDDIIESDAGMYILQMTYAMMQIAIT